MYLVDERENIYVADKKVDCPSLKLGGLLTMCLVLVE
jgi:hypothetical protein